MRRWLVTGIFAIAIVFGTWKFWNLGSIPQEKSEPLTLTIEHPGVEVRPQGSGTWSPATNGMTLKNGDMVHTDGEGNATIHFFGHGEARLGKQTEITIQQASQESGLQVRLALASGRIWSRIRRFMDISERYQIENNTVVATVRGTAFDLQATATGTSVWVSESAVALESKDVHRLLIEGYMLTAKPNGNLGKEEAITDSSKQTEWFQKNANRDQVFETTFRQAVERTYQDRGGADPQTLGDGLTRLSEWLHLTFRPSDAKRLYPAYTGRRLYHLTKIMEQGNEGLGLQEYGNLEDEIVQRVKNDHTNAYREGMKHELEALSFLLSKTGPRSKAYRLKQRLEDLRVKLSDTPTDQAHARILAVEARLDEASDLITQSSLDDAKTALDAAKQGVENATRDLERLPKEPTPNADEVSALHDKLQLLRNREASLRVRLATALAPPTSGGSSGAMALPLTVTSTLSTGTSTEGVPQKTATSSTEGPSATTTRPTPPAEKPAPKPIQLQALRLLPGSATLSGGQSVTFQALAVYSDGTSKDVTALSLLSASNLRLGFILRDAFTANPGMEGTVDVTASYTESGKTVRSTTSIVIHP